MSYTESKCAKSHVTAGPWGGTSGARWDDGVYSSVRQLIITHSPSLIHSLQIEYADANSHSVWSEKHGGAGAGIFSGSGTKTEKFKLDHPDEYLVSISGFFGSDGSAGPNVVRSLTLESNRRRYGPFGSPKGTQFSFSMTGGKIAGFYGRCGTHLDSVGVYLKPFVTVKTTITTTQAQAHAQAQSLAQAHMGAVVGGKGNRGFDVMVAVREKMDNMILGTTGGGGYTEYEKKEKILSHEDVKGKPYYTQDEKEQDNYTFMTGTGYREYDHRLPLSVSVGLPNKGHLPVPVPNERLPIRRTEASNHGLIPYTGYEAKEKVYTYTSIDGEKGYSNTRHTGAENGHFMPSHNIDFSEYESRDNKMTAYGVTGAEKYPRQTKDEIYYMKQKDGNLHVSNKAFNEYETKEKMYSSNGNTKVYETMGKPALSYGPWGGSGGALFDDGVYTGIREIHVARSAGISYIKVCYDMNGKAVWGEKNGGTGAIRLDKISLDYPEEYLTRVSGYYGSTIFRGPTAIKSLTFHTNKKKYGPFGEEQGIPFSSVQKEGIIVGFHGTKGLLLDSIGVHFIEGKFQLPRPSIDMTYTPSNIKTNAFHGPEKVPTQFGSGFVQPGIVNGNGPWGGNGGSPWDDGVYTGIKKIILTKGEAILAIQIEYDRNGHSIWSHKHGSNDQGSCHVVQFEYPQETLTGLSGYYGSIGGDERKKVVKSLTFHTNKRRYGPFGEEIGTQFTFSGKIVGFNGKSGCYLDAIGVHPQQHFVNDRVDQSGSIKSLLHKIFA